MGERIVVKEQLTEEMIEAGAALIEKMDTAGVRINLALWWFDLEVAEWQLVFSTPEADIYEYIHQAEKEIGDKAKAIPSMSYYCWLPGSEMAQAFRASVQTGPGIHRTRFRKEYVGPGYFVQDSLIYRSA